MSKNKQLYTQMCLDFCQKEMPGEGFAVGQQGWSKETISGKYEYPAFNTSSNSIYLCPEPDQCNKTIADFLEEYRRQHTKEETPQNVTPIPSTRITDELKSLSERVDILEQKEAQPDPVSKEQFDALSEKVKGLESREEQITKADELFSKTILNRIIKLEAKINHRKSKK